ncbi:ATP-binding protein [Pseudoalteromonas sp. 13-15]|uniref:ATP-binding protein n=1 Tax=Pseudoalteromonas TaxID=53246 RepID=UPI000730B6E6|nr:MULTISPECIES: ATP-binding protein [Pseudoalteromonas]AUL75329.1 ATP-binding protein [Pseudoalteromonas sp. 13-15]WFO20873.1 ATP-binding protein [Pseudoalteromonas sp. H100]SIO23159.1 Histidine kinase-, DNA gyrase B-, and HSP90-like ATPase [Pseudoalteromonas marina]
MSNRFLSAETVIESLRDNGYNNTAYALAELIDNSLQATANRVEVGFIEEQLNARKNYTVSEISLWDNGVGMDIETLRVAMQFGGGTHRKDTGGMGKFGMGLPNSSISQCKRVDVWSWQAGGEPHHTYLDVDEMKSGALEEVPMPTAKAIPSKYEKAFFTKKPESGTLIIWSKLDRLSWKTGKSIYRHCEHLVGRMYRNFISDDNIKIESITYRKSAEDRLDVYDKETFKANDPMYLKKNTSLPELPGSYKNEAFFEKMDEEVISVEYIDENGEPKRDDVTVTTSMVKKNISNRILKDTVGKLGGTTWGKHCSKNVGVSIVRANRELVLRDSFLTSALRESKGRFIGIEVSFPPTLDSVFGVTNNKQDAIRLIPYEMKTIFTQAGFDSEQEYLRDLEENSDSLLQVLKVVAVIKKHVSALTKELDTINVEGKAVKGEEPKTVSEGAASKATQGSAHRETHGHKTKEETPKELKKEDVVDHLKKAGGMSDEEAEEKAERLILTGNRFLIEDVARDSEAFFDVSTSKGLTLVLFNTNHVFYQKLVSKLDGDELEIMQTTIAGFARVMNETTDERRLAYLNTIRREWGLVISEFLQGPEDDELDDF